MTVTRAHRSGGGVTMSDVRIILIGAGMLILVVGAVVIATAVAPSEYPAIALWLAGALIVHDVLIAGVAFAVAFAGRRAMRHRPLRAILLVQSALAVGAIVGLLVLPEVVAKAVGATANPSILPLDYGVNLALLCVALAVMAVIGISLLAVLARRPKSGNLSS